jgi:hypothetical protein
MQSLFGCLSLAYAYQRLTQGGSSPSRSHNTKAP